MTQILINQSHEFEIVVLDALGNFDTTGNVSVDIQNTITGVSVASGNMSIQGNTYKFDHTFVTLGQFRILYTSPSSFENGLETIEVVNKITDQVWDEPLASHVTLLSTGEALGTTKSKTDNLPVDPASEANATLNASNINLNIDANELKLDAIQLDMTTALADIETILALVHENSEVVDQIFDVNGNLLSANVIHYANASDLDAQINAIRSFQITSTYDVNGLNTSFKMKRIL